MVQYFLRIVLFFVVCLSFHIRAQDTAWNNKTDSLKLALSNADSDTNKASILLQLCKILPADQYEQAVEYAEQAVAFAVLSDEDYHIVNAYTELGALYSRHSDYSKAVTCFQLAIKTTSAIKPFLAPTYLELGIAYLRLSKLDSSELALKNGLKLNVKRNDVSLEASFYNMLGNVYKDKDDYKVAIQHYLKATDLFEEEKDDAGLAQSVSNTGNVQYLLGNYGLAEEYALKSLDYARKINKRSSIAYSNRLLGRIYRKQRRFDDALINYGKALTIYVSLDAQRDVSETHYNIGNIYYEKLDFTSAIAHYKKALAIQKQRPDPYNLAYSYLALGMASYEIQAFSNSQQFLDSAKRLATQHQFPYIMLDALDYTSRYFEVRGQHLQALEQLKMYNSLRDSLSTEENRMAAREVEAKYQNEKKEEEIRSLNAANQIAELQMQKQRSQRNYLIGLSVLALLLIVLLYNGYKVKLKAAKKLQELDQMKSRFFTNLSHEFRTPLSLITGPLQKKLEEARSDEERLELEMMNRNAQRLSILINQLLDLSKLESGSMKLRVREDDLAQTLKIVAASFTSLADHKGIKFIVQIEPDTAPTFFDADTVEKVLFNLLSNAFKFTHSKGAVYFRASVVNRHAVISVKDTGVGIPKDKLPLVFNRFYQVDDTANRLQEGSGIGLALCKELTDLHRGTLTVASEDGQGSEFVFTIPVSRDAYRKTQIAGTERKTPRAQPIQDKGIRSSGELPEEGLPLIMIAEDNDDMRLYISNTLRLNYRVIGVSDGKKAFEKAVETVPDLIVTDVMMPQMDGNMLCKKLKTSPETSHIPVVMLTAKADHESKLDGLQLGADDYLIKPFDARELLIRVHNLIQQRKHLQERFRKQVILQPRQLELNSTDEQFLTTIMSTLEKNYTNPDFGVDQLTEHTHMSRMQLHRKLKALSGKAPGDFLRHFRLERAKQFLLQGLTISEVSFKAGFNHNSTFSKAFRDYTGTTPTEFLSREKADNPPAARD